MTRRLLLLLLIISGLAGVKAQAQFGGKSHLTPSLFADTKSVVAGQPFTVGIVLKMDEGWHSYWQYPGEFGMKTTAEWQLPPGFKADPVQWPLPRVHFEDDQLSYIYEGEVMLLVRITPPAILPAGDLKISAALRWQVCQKTCIPGNATVELTLPTASTAEPDHAEEFAKWRGELPQSPAPFSSEWTFPSPKELKISLRQVPAGVTIEDFYPLPPQAGSGRAEAPAIIVAVPPKLSPAAANGDLEITVALNPQKTPETPWSGVVIGRDAAGKRTGWVIAPEAGAQPQGATASPRGTTGATLPLPPANGPARPPGSSQGTLAGALLLAFTGGLILNVMPCVLPVIALKIFGFVKQAGDDPRRVLRLGLAFVAGVFTFFLGLASAAIILKLAGRGFNWGYQFQNPYMLAGLTALVFVFGLNLLGVFEVTLSSTATTALSEASSREGYGGAFLHGLFTTLLGTSCTAPIMGPSLGYAVTQPAPIVILLFLAIAAGMSLPYLLLTARPAWMKFLPKPGAWMERFKQVMGFIMLAVGVWLFTVFAARGSEAVQALSWYLLALAVACWLMGILARRGLAISLALAIAIGGYFALLHGRLEASPTHAEATNDPAGIQWAPFTEAGVNSAIGQGQPVFIDFTADWCPNCYFFEGHVLRKGVIAAAFRDKKIAAFRGDWTNGDPKITAWLNRFQRVGVPVYLLYRPGEVEPIVQDGLTVDGLLEQLKPLK